MSTHANMVKMTVSSVGADPYTITLNAASSGFQSFADAYGANATVDILITQGTVWEVARNCTYTHSGTTVTRGTFEDSSTGSRITTFDNTAVVSVVATADSGRRWDSAALEHVAGTDADTTMAVGMLYVVPMSAWATADRTYTLPADAAAGSRIGIMVTSGNASYELIIKPGASDTINGGTAAAEWSRLFITGEVVILRCVTTNSAWVVEHDGRVPALVVMYKDSVTNVADTTITKINVNTTDVDSAGGYADTTNYRVNIRRSGTFQLIGRSAASGVAIIGSQTRIHKNGSFLRLASSDIPAGTNGIPAVVIVPLAAGDYIDMHYRHATGAARDYWGASGDATAAALEMLEIL